MRGRCSKCGQIRQVTSAGVLQRHAAAGLRSVECLGGGLPPEADPEIRIKRPAAEPVGVGGEQLRLRGMEPRDPRPRVPGTVQVGRCRHCGHLVSARDGETWREMARGPCPHCGRAGW